MSVASGLGHRMAAKSSCYLPRRRVTMREDADGNVHLRNLSMHQVNSEEDALNYLFLVRLFDSCRNHVAAQLLFLWLSMRRETQIEQYVKHR